jgi:single-strand DNA-binding protein
MNSWNFTGNAGRDAEIRYLANGDAITSWSVAVKAGYGKNEVTSWVSCSIYGKRGEAVADFIKKGNQIGVSGEGLLRTWDAKDGSKASSLECRVNDVTLLGSKNGDNGNTPSQDRKPNQQNSDFDDLESVPF